MWDLQTFETSLKPHLSPAVNTNMGCHFKRDFRNPVSWYYSETFFVAKRAIGWSLLVKSSLVFWFFFLLLPFFFFLSNGGVWAELRFAQTPGQDRGWCAKFQPRVIFQKGWDMYQPGISRCIMARLTGPYLWCLLLLLLQPLHSAGIAAFPQHALKPVVVITLKWFVFYSMVSPGSQLMWQFGTEPSSPGTSPKFGSQLSAKLSTVPPLSQMLLPLLCLCMRLFLSLLKEGKKKKNHISTCSAVDLLIRRVKSVMEKLQSRRQHCPAGERLAGSGCAEHLLPS